MPSKKPRKKKAVRITAGDMAKYFAGVKPDLEVWVQAGMPWDGDPVEAVYETGGKIMVSRWSLEGW